MSVPTRPILLWWPTVPDAVLEFRFNRLTGSAVTEEGYYGLIDRIRFQRGFTFIDKALLMADRDIFTTAAGMRPQLPQV